jgi:hypothetical protein
MQELGGGPLRASFQAPTRLGTGRNPLEVYAGERQKKVTFQWSSHPYVRGSNGVIYVCIPELQN